MKIGLIDVDGHHFPNIALMKISAFHKQIGDSVEWWNPSTSYYDIVYKAKVFSDAYSKDMIYLPLNAGRIIKGGTGYAISLHNGKEVYNKEYDNPLPQEIENIYPDYSLYPEYTQDKAYGFLTRGCPRGCHFCHVVAKEGRRSHKVANLSQFWSGQKNIMLSDPNILACSEVQELLQQLVDSKATIQFNQGLDARLITEQLAQQLASMKVVNVHFAMDTMQNIASITKGLNLYREAFKETGRKWTFRNAKVFVLTNYNTTFEEDMERIKIIQQAEYRPFVMVYNKPSAPTKIRRLQRWANGTIPYLKYRDSFERFLQEQY